jgi:ABA4-like protein
MSPDQIFSIANLAAFVSWVLLAVFPRRRAVDALVGTVAPVALAIVYTTIIVAALRNSEGGFSSLAGVAAFFSNPWLLLAGWIHYLAFDLLIGRWEVRDAQEHGVRYVLVVPCLALTFLFGPAGWLLYRGVRYVAASDRTISAGPAGAGHPQRLA